MPSKHVSIARQDLAILLYALDKGYALNVGKIMEESILDYAEEKFLGNTPHPSLITLLCIKGGVQFNEQEERKGPRPHPSLFLESTKLQWRVRRKKEERNPTERGRRQK